ncbi:glycosyltransferase involved in cell wall biosynthesis [Wenyingzhuangia heitensis]|uniref:Glycosyltransferase involved in cell wall biosynthesis n=1 Tax=Wenyingzhuangia heitensis TaxID=1487859 RepID=A0ABX0UAC3_9FLAO|nr:glycosyltransferase family 1 protein [Wenyingzhuangia heitensis]NIJ45769.1 glycosyltransferase involved in cell wall biosynthesis [Wenyingzhuangia heitensis]
MKLLIDPQVFNFQKYGGISRYYTEIFSRIEKQTNNKIINPIYNSRNIYFNESILIGPKQILHNFIYLLMKLLGKNLRDYYDKKNIKKTISKLTKGEFDVFVTTYYNPYFLDYIGDKPFVVTVYDMIHELFPEYFQDDSFNVVQNKEILLKKASKIIAVSKNTKKDILRFYPEIDEKKIEVVYHGQSIKKSDFNIPSIKLPQKYILYVGSRATYKNFEFFLDSVTPILKNDASISVLFAGAGEFTEEECGKFKALGIMNQVNQYDFKENELGTIYNKALCFVFPSKYEGFGIPVLEAMYCGCPVVLTNYSSFPEVSDNAGVYYEKDSVEDLRDKIVMLINNSEKRKKHIDLGYKRIQLFNWDIATEECSKVYKSVLKNNS